MTYPATASYPSAAIAAAKTSVPVEGITLTQRTQRLAAQAKDLVGLAMTVEKQVSPGADEKVSSQIPEPDPDHIHWALESLERRLNALGEILSRVANTI